MLSRHHVVRSTQLSATRKRRGHIQSRVVGSSGTMKRSREPVSFAISVSIMAMTILAQSLTVEGMSWSQRDTSRLHRRVSELSRASLGNTAALKSSKELSQVQATSIYLNQEDGEEDDDDDDSRVEFAFLRPDSPSETAAQLRETEFSFTQWSSSAHNGLTELDHLESLASPCWRPSRCKTRTTSGDKMSDNSNNNPAFVHS